MIVRALFYLTTVAIVAELSKLKEKRTLNDESCKSVSHIASETVKPTLK